MSQLSGKPIYIPPYSGVRLIECRDHFQLVPVPAVRTVFGYGKVQVSKAYVHADEINPLQFWTDLEPDDEIWTAMQWFVYEDGHQEPGNISYLRPECTEDDARKSMERMMSFVNTTREEALDMLKCFDAKEEDYQEIEDNFPNYQSEPDPKATDEYDVYHARLKVLEDLQPKTVALIKIANATKDLAKRQIAEHEAVQSYFAELAHYFTEDEILAWQRTNPVGTGWMCEFGEVMREPRRTLDPVNHELALNWLREKYNHLTARELSESIFKKIFRWLNPDAIRKRWFRLGLTSKRDNGPRPNSER